MFSENESIYAMDHEGMAYNSIVVSVRRCSRGENAGRHEYLVHFQGWAARFDEWIPTGSERLCAEDGEIRFQVQIS